MTNSPAVPIRDLSNQLKAVCATCSLRELCVPQGLTAQELDDFEEVVARRKSVKSSELLYRTGDPFNALYAVRSGSFKTRLTSEDGREQVLGFQLPGELLGLDGAARDLHSVDAVALRDSEVCLLPFAQLEEVAQRFAPLQRQLHRVMSREIVREQSVMLLLGNMRAEERLAAFLLNLSQRYAALGYSPTEFVLTMTRSELGNHLGLKVETVSRVFSKLQRVGLLAVEAKKVKLCDIAALRRLAGL